MARTAKLYILRPALRTNEPNKQGECPLVMKLTYNGRQPPFKIPFGRSVHPKHWDTEGAAPKRSCPLYAVLSRLVSDGERDAETALEEALQAGPITAEEANVIVRRVLMPTRAETHIAGVSVLDYLAEAMKDAAFTAKWGKTTRVLYEKNINALRLYLPVGVTMAGLTHTILTLTGERMVVEGEMAPQTANNVFKVLRAACKYAFRRGDLEKDPFDGWQRLEAGKGTRVRKPYPLTMAQCDLIEQVADSSDTTRAETALYFLLECYSGLRYSDWNAWRLEHAADGDYIRFPQTTKTGVPIRIFLNNSPRLSSVIRRIRERCPKYTRSYNMVDRNLKQIAAAHPGELPEMLSSHFGRHTAASQLHDLMGFELSEIADVLGVEERVAKGYITATRSIATRAFKTKGGL